MGLALGSYIIDSHIPPKEMTADWNSFTEVKAPEPIQMGTLFDAGGEVTTPSSLLQQLKSDKSLSVPTIQKDGFFITEKNWYLIVRN